MSSGGFAGPKPKPTLSLGLRSSTACFALKLLVATGPPLERAITCQDFSMTAEAIQLEVWSDIACPWCYIGKRSLESALELVEFPVEVTWRSFELDPGAAASYGRPMPELLAKKYGGTIDQALEGMARVEAAAAERGIHYDLAKARGGNTVNWHRLVKYAERKDLGFAMMERLFEAYLSEGVDLSEAGALALQAQQVSLDPEDVATFLEGDELLQAVRDDESLAANLGISAVPAFVANRAYVVNGAQPPAVLMGFLVKVFEESQQASE